MANEDLTSISQPVKSGIWSKIQGFVKNNKGKVITAITTVVVVPGVNWVAGDPTGFGEAILSFIKSLFGA